MAVLVEGISVIVRRKSIEDKCPLGWNGFVDNMPNATLCADDEIARVGFMTPQDVKDFIEHLESCGLVFREDNKAVDIAVADQIGGLTLQCDWLEFGQVTLNESGTRVAACRYAGSHSTQLITPENWQYEESLSNTHVFAPSETLDETLKFLRHENGLDIYLNLVTGKEVYAGRTTRKIN